MNFSWLQYCTNVQHKRKVPIVTCLCSTLAVIMAQRVKGNLEVVGSLLGSFLLPLLDFLPLLVVECPTSGPSKRFISTNDGKVEKGNPARSKQA